MAYDTWQFEAIRREIDLSVWLFTLVGQSRVRLHYLPLGQMPVAKLVLNDMVIGSARYLLRKKGVSLTVAGLKATSVSTVDYNE